MVFIIAACTFGAVMLLFVGLTMRSEHEILKERMERHAQTGSSGGSSVELEMSVPFRERVLLPFLRKLADIGYRLTPSGATEQTDARLETAGRPWNLGAREFMGLRVLSVALFLFLAYAAVRWLPGAPLMRMMMPIIIVFIGVIMPDYMLQQAINTRQSKIRRVLPDTLDLMTVSVEAGLGLDGAMQRVIDKFKNPLCDEMGRALYEMQIGKLRSSALRDMASRARVDELTSFVAAVVQADQLGVSIAKVLRVQGETIRMIRGQKAREEAAKLPVKMLFPLVFFIFPAIFVVILAPAAIRIGHALDIF